MKKMKFESKQHVPSTCLNVSTTPLQQWGFRQCLPFSWTKLKGKHCRHRIAVLGVVHTFRPWQQTLLVFNAFYRVKIWIDEEWKWMALWPRCEPTKPLKFVLIARPIPFSYVIIWAQAHWLSRQSKHCGLISNFLIICSDLSFLRLGH